MRTTTPRATGPSDPCVMVIFGAAGDLTRRKLVPALCNLASDGLLSRQFAIVGVSHHDLTTEALRARLAEDLERFAPVPVAPEVRARILERVHYVRGGFEEAATYQRLKEAVAQVARDSAIPPNHFYYLAVAPAFFGTIVRQLGEAGLAGEEEGHWRRVVVEKPFGRDLESARALNAEITQVFSESQIYRIDHYLGKETVQNLLVFRFGNAIFEPIWNRQYIDHVQITAAETIGVEQRGGYYETAGALRDMVPTHLLQLLSLTAMEAPTCFEADAVRDEQTKVLRAIQEFTPATVLDRAVRGQYDEGQLDGRRVPAYRAEPKVARESGVETFVALKLLIDNWRWAGVPFYLRTGKRLAGHVTEIALQFQRVPFKMFCETGVDSLQTNRLVIRIQPDEGIALRFGAKVPGPRHEAGGRADGLQVPRLLRLRAHHRVRAAAVRLHDRRHDAVPARRHRGGRVARDRARARCLERAARPIVPQLPRGHVGPCRKPMRCWRATAASGGRRSRDDRARDPGVPGCRDVLRAARGAPAV